MMGRAESAFSHGGRNRAGKVLSPSTANVRPKVCFLANFLIRFEALTGAARSGT
jgi:hypothetical protein